VVRRRHFTFLRDSNSLMYFSGSSLKASRQPVQQTQQVLPLYETGMVPRPPLTKHSGPRPVQNAKESGTTSPPAGVSRAWTTRRGVPKGRSRTEPSASTNWAPPE
jgi:hypothetical protein